MSLLPVDEAQARLLAQTTPLPPQTVPLAEAAGRYLAEPLSARRDQPWTDLSAMDGYAIRFADLPGPWQLVGAVPAGAGQSTATLAPGTALRIFTGAPMPPGADSVVLQEDVDGQGGLIRLTGDGPGQPGKHVRPRASDFAEGAVLLPAGLRLGPPRMALAALAGHAEVCVRARPRIAILSTGDELVAPGTPCPPGKLPASNDIMLRTMLEGAGARVIASRIVPDDLPLLVDALRACADADVIVTTGGASVGDHDLVRPALEGAGGAIAFWRIAMRPGKPLIYGRLGPMRVLGLPGNPVSSLVCSLLFLRPLVEAMLGLPSIDHVDSATLGGPVRANDGRQDYLRADIAVSADGTRIATPFDRQDSSMLSTFAKAGCLIIRPPHAPPATAGEACSVIILP